MREEVIVYVKTEMKSDDEEERDIIPGPSTTRSVEPVHVVSSSTEPDVDVLEDHDDEDSVSCDWPCAVCGRLFYTRESTLAHLISDHAEQLLQGYIQQCETEVKSKLANLKTAQASLSHQHRTISAMLSTPTQHATSSTTSNTPPSSDKSDSCEPVQPLLASPPFRLLPPPTVPRLPYPVPISFPTPTILPPTPPKPIARAANAQQQQIESAESLIARRGRPRHPVWSLFARIDKFDAECTICKSRVRSACPTNLCRHLNNNHCELAKQLFAKWKKDKELCGGSFPPLSKTMALPRPEVHKSTTTFIRQKPTAAHSQGNIDAGFTASQKSVPSTAVSPIILALQQQRTMMLQQLGSIGNNVEAADNILRQLGANEKMLAAAQQQVLAKLQQDVQGSILQNLLENVRACNNDASGAGVIRFVSQNAAEKEGSTKEEASTKTGEAPSFDSSSISSPSSFIDASFPRPFTAPAPDLPDDEDLLPQPNSRSRTAPPNMLCINTAPTQIDSFCFPAVENSDSAVGATVHVESTSISVPEVLKPTFDTAAWLSSYGNTLALDAAALMHMHNTGSSLGLSMNALTAVAALAECQPNPNLDESILASTSTSSDVEHGVKQEMIDVDDVLMQQLPSTSAPPPTKRGRPTENPCWSYFHRVDDQNVKCRLCEKIVKSACATNMTKHLERHHSEDHHILLQQIKTYRLTKPTASASAAVGDHTVHHQLPQHHHLMPTTSMATSLDHLTHAPNHHLLQNMTTDHVLGGQMSHNLPLSPDPSPAVQHCLLQGNQHFLKDPSLLISATGELMPDPSHYLNTNLYATPFAPAQDGMVLHFDDAHNWQWNWQGAEYDPRSAAVHVDPNSMLIDPAWHSASLSGLHPSTVIQSSIPAPASAVPSSSIPLDPLSIEHHSAHSAQAHSSMLAPPSSSTAVPSGSATSTSSSSSTVSTSSVSSSAGTVTSRGGGGGGAGSSSGRGGEGSSKSHEPKPYMKRNRKTEHPVWEFFKRTADGNAQCSICMGVVKSPCSSNFMRHLMRHHNTEYNDVYFKWCQKRGPLTSSKDATPTATPAPPGAPPPQGAHMHLPMLPQGTVLQPF